MGEEKPGDETQRDSSAEATEEKTRPSQSGPTFTESPDPLAGIKKASGDAWKSTEGKTVSMRVYVGSIIAVVVLMMLARCGG